MRSRKLRLGGNRPLETSKRLFLPANSMERQAAIEPILGTIRCQRQGAIITVDCSGVEAKVAKDVGEMAMGHSKIRGERNRLLQALDRLVMRSKCAQSAPQQHLSVRVACIAD